MLRVVFCDTDVSNLQARLARLQGRLGNTRLFGRGISKEARESLMATMKEIQEKVGADDENDDSDDDDNDSNDDNDDNSTVTARFKICFTISSLHRTLSPTHTQVARAMVIVTLKLHDSRFVLQFPHYTQNCLQHILKWPDQ